MTNQLSLPALTRLSWRDISRDIRAMRLLVLLLFLGTILIAMIGSLSQSLQQGLQRDARILLGGDLVIRRAQQTLPDDLTETIARLAGSDIAANQIERTDARTLRTMLHPVTNQNAAPLLISLLAMDQSFPVAGQFAPTNHAGESVDFSFAANDLGYPGLYADPLIAESLNINIGDPVRIGQQHFIFKGEFDSFPGTAAQNFALAPYVMISLTDLADTGLTGYGSLSHSRATLALNNPPDLEKLSEQIQQAYPNEGLIIRHSQNATPGLSNLINRFSLYLSLTGILALLIGGLGMQHAIKAYLRKRQKTIAMLKSMGLTQSHIIKIYVIQLGFCCLFALLPALGLAAIAPTLVAHLLDTSLPFATGPFPAPLVEAGGYAILILFSFALPILYNSRHITATQAFHSHLTQEHILGWRYFATLTRSEKRNFAFLFLPILGLLLWIFIFREDYLLTYVILLGCAILWFCLSWISRVIQKVAARSERKYQQQGNIHKSAPNPVFRLMLMRLKQPHSVLHSALSALGLGMAGLAMVLLCQQAMLSLIDQRLPEKAPSFFVLDLPPSQKDDFIKATESFDQADIIAQLPMLRGAITAIKGVPVQEARIDPEAAWAVQGDRGISFSREMPEGTEIVQGDWWTETEANQLYISLDDKIAKGFGMSLGDELTVSILGRPFTAVLHNTRDIDWSSFSMNFTILFAPGPLEKAPYNLLLTLKTPIEQDGAFLRKMASDFANLTFVPVRQLLEQLNEKLNGLAIALQIAAFVTCLTGFMVLISALIASQENERRDLAIFSMLGVSVKTLFWAHAIEFLVLGCTTIGCALLFGSLGAWGLISGPFNLPFSPSWALIGGLTIGGTICLTLTALWIRRRDLLSPPTSVLRNS